MTRSWLSEGRKNECKIAKKMAGNTLEEDSQTVSRLNPNYPDGFFKLIDLLATVDNIRGDDVGHHEDVIEEEEVFGSQLASDVFLHPKHSLGKESSIAVNKRLTAWSECVLDHLNPVACLLLMSG